MKQTQYATDHGRFVPALKYRWLTPYYDLVMRLTTRERTFKAALIDQAGITAGQRVLDLACGTGTLAVWLKLRGADTEVHGIDGDAEILRLAVSKARRSGADVTFSNALSNALPYPDAYFDRVLSSLFFHHLHASDKDATATEVLRVIKPGGELHVADWGKAANFGMRLLFVPVQLLDGFRNTSDNVHGRLPAVFAQAGFENIEQTKAFSTVFGTLALYRATKPV